MPNIGQFQILAKRQVSSGPSGCWRNIPITLKPPSWGWPGSKSVNAWFQQLLPFALFLLLGLSFVSAQDITFPMADFPGLILWCFCFLKEFLGGSGGKGCLRGCFTTLEQPCDDRNQPFR
jgi:hypothetical protein